MMLSALKITRFKSIRDLELEFGTVNLFVGGNGSGKSNILEAIALTSACLGRGLGDSDISAKGMRLTPAELMKSSFKNEVLPRTLELEAQFNSNTKYKVVLQSRETDPLLRFFSEACEIDGKRIFGRSNRGARATGVSHANRLDPTRGIWDQIKATYDLPDHVTNTFGEFSRFCIYAPQTDFLRGKQAGRIDSPPVGLQGGGLPEAVTSYLAAWRKANVHKNALKPVTSTAEIINQCINLVWLPRWASAFGTHKAQALLTSRDIVDRSSETVYFIDRFMHASRNRLSVYDSSEGTLFLLFAAIVLSHPDAPRFFALDNVDNALNPRLTRQLVETIINVAMASETSGANLGAKQVFLTSHNPTSLDAFDIFDQRQRVFVVRRNEKGHTIATRLKPSSGIDKQKWELIMGGRNLSQVWLDGDIPGALGEI